MIGQGEILALILLVALGTYLTRALPLLAALLRRGDAPGRETKRDDPAGGTGGLLPLVGPSVIAALLVTSLLPDPSESGFWLRLVLGVAALVPACLAAVRWRNLGLTVLAGVASYLLVSALF
jgi:branched-subunit amino acid transport protein